MDKLYERIEFKNEQPPALNEDNLNAMSRALEELDNRVIKIAPETLMIRLKENIELFDQTQNLYEEAAKNAISAKSYAVGSTGSRTGENTDNAKYYKEQAKNSATDAVNAAEEAKQCRDEAEQFKKEAFSNTPEGYENLVQNVADNTVKIDTVINKAELNIKNTASGDSIHLKDSANGKIEEFALYGKAVQRTTIGKNFYNVMNTNLKNSYSFMEKSSDSLRVYSYSAYTYVSVGKHVDYTKMQAGKTYTLSAYVTINKGAGCLTLRTDGGQIIIGTSKITSSGWHKVTFALPDKEGLYFSFFATMDTAEIGDVTYSNIQVEEGDTRTEYEPYTGCMASPNPDYPQEIKVSGASGSVVVKSCGKNLTGETLTAQDTYTENGITFTLNENKSVRVKGTSTKVAQFHYYFTARFTGMVVLTGSNETNCSIYPWDWKRNARPYADESKTTLQTGFQKANNRKVRFFVEKGVKYSVCVKAENSTTYDCTIYPMVRRCDEDGNPIGDDTYEPYKETVATISTPNGFVGIPTESGGNYTDENGQQYICDEVVKYADGSGERIQRIKKVIYDGTNMKFSAKSSSTTNNIFYSDSTTMDFKMPSSYDSLPNIISSHFVRCSRNDGYDGSGKCIYGSSTYPNIYIGFGADTEITTVDKANEWLKSNNVTVYYEIKNPIRTPLTSEEIAEIEKLCTFYPVTHISNDSDCGMKVSYLADSKNYIDNQLALQAQAQEAAMINMLLLLPEETQAAMIENDTNNLLTESEE